MSATKDIRIEVREYDPGSGEEIVETVTMAEILNGCADDVTEAVNRLIETGEPQVVIGQASRWTYSLAKHEAHPCACEVCGRGFQHRTNDRHVCSVACHEKVSA